MASAAIRKTPEPIRIHPDNWQMMGRLRATLNDAKRLRKPSQLVYEMAEANLQLPKRHPNKITSGMVDALEELLTDARLYAAGPEYAGDPAYIETVEALRAALIALLPPEVGDA